MCLYSYKKLILIPLICHTFDPTANCLCSILLNTVQDNDDDLFFTLFLSLARLQSYQIFHLPVKEWRSLIHSNNDNGRVSISSHIVMQAWTTWIQCNVHVYTPTGINYGVVCFHMNHYNLSFKYFLFSWMST